jgi:hypothetical protein
MCKSAARHLLVIGGGAFRGLPSGVPRWLTGLAAWLEGRLEAPGCAPNAACALGCCGSAASSSTNPGRTRPALHGIRHDGITKSGWSMSLASCQLCAARPTDGHQCLDNTGMRASAARIHVTAAPFDGALDHGILLLQLVGVRR